ncbi:MAG: hypothetical protein J6Y19_05785 [Kiritimatiellae bacterium]|nr:hypothetical protein [Kiritimatiellia bacterium]
MKNGTRILAMAAVLAAAVAAQGAELAAWNSTGATNPLAGTFPVTRVASGVTVSNLTSGPGLLLSGSSPSANSFSAGGYDKTSAATAMSGNDWWETCLDAGANGLVLESLKYAFRASGSGPKNAQWAWSTDRSAWHYLGTEETINDKWVERTAVDLSGIPDASRVWLRMVAWGGGTANNAWGGFGKEDVLKIYGEVLSSEGEPTVGFSPASPWTYAKETLVVQVKARPAGTKVTKMSVSPTPKGTVTPNLSAGTWTFTPSTNDANKTFQLTVAASNAYGTAEGSVEVRVKGAVTKGTLTIDFEGVTGESTDWKGATLSLPAGSGTNWVLEGSIVRNGYSSDRKNEKAALVFTSNAVGSIRSQGKVLDKGIGKISYCYGVNTNHLDAGRPMLRTLVSEDGEFWVEADAADTAELGADGALAERSFDVGVGVPVYLEFRCDGFSGSAQVNLDDVVIQPKSAGTPYDQKLLRFNVTPGDPGTESAQDLDGDGATNSKDAHPYDPDVK